MSNKNSFTCKLSIVGSESVCILNSEWSNEDVKFLLLHDNQAWSGQFQFSGDGDVAELLDLLSLTEEKYIEETKNALTTHGGAQNFTYTIENDKFTWKKCVSTKMAIKFGYVYLSKIPIFDVFEKIIDNTLQLNVNVSENLVSAERKKEVLEKENLLLKTKLNDLIEEKNEMETTLYSQFLSVLNEKKKRILELKKKLGPSKCNESDPDIQQSESDPFDSDTEIDSEEEEKHSPSKTEVVENKDSLDMEEENTIILPKRSRRTTRDENVAGPSRSRNARDENVAGPSRSRTTRNKNVAGPSRTTSDENVAGPSTSKPQPSKHFSNLHNKRTAKKGGAKESCVIDKFTEKKEDSFEEDPFMFPKRSKRSTQQCVTVKPSTSKIKYESDDDTYLETTQKLDTDSDRTSSLIGLVESGYNTVKIETVPEDELECNTIGLETSSNQTETNLKNPKKENNVDFGCRRFSSLSEDNTVKIETVNEGELEYNSVGLETISNKTETNFQKPKEENNSEVDYRGFSSSTLNMLNQLI